jgi:hypothetical protein
VNETKIGEYHFAQGNIGLIDAKLVFMKISAKSKGGMYDPYFLKNPVKEAWDKVVETYNHQAPPGINTAR